MTCVYRISLFASLVSGSAWALDPLPEGHGISKLHPRDKSIANHPSVLLAEDFEAATLAAIKPRWNKMEKNGSYGSLPAPGGWMFYTYWNDMKPSAGGRFWGNGLWPEGRPAPPRGQWQCVEIMVKCNDIGQSNGELALWLDGKLATHIRPGTKTGQWTGEGFQVSADGTETFEGFRWRTVPELAVSYFMLSHYVTENAYRQNKIADPPKLNRVWFDDIVVATEYIGPITQP